MHSILAVDDEPNNLDLMIGFLDEDKYTIDTAVDGVDALAKVQDENNKYDLILLDRMMPNMNGMEFLEKIRSPETGELIVPVIMQTAAAEKSQIDEGIKAGVFHYLTKPYDDKTLSDIVEACLEDTAKKHKLQAEVTTQKRIEKGITACRIRFKNLFESHLVATYIATLYPEPQRVILGLSEILLNAVEHGSLGITYEQKSKLHENHTWDEEIKRMLELEENKDKFVEVDFVLEDTAVILHVKDQGEGFDWQKYISLSPERATHRHGRGIAMSKALSFDSIEYKGCGNEVECVVKRS